MKTLITLCYNPETDDLFAAIIQDDYEYQNSREFFEEEAQANEYEFEEDGTRY